MAAASFNFGKDDLDKSKLAEKVGKELGTDLKVLISKRRSKRGSATKCVNFIHNNLSTLSADELGGNLNKLRLLLSDLDELDDKVIYHAIDEKVYTDEEVDAQLEINEMYSDKIRLAIYAIESLSSSSNDISPKHTNAKLPKVELPTFSGSAEEFERFITSFEAIINKHNLPSYEKYLYLKGQLSGAPKVLIESLPLGDLTYESARKLLNDAFCDKVAQQFGVIGKLVNLKLTNEGDSYLWISNVRTVVDQVKCLAIDINIVLQYFIWNSLNDKFKEHLIAITNKSKPSLSEILDNMFEANTRYQSHTEELSNLEVCTLSRKGIDNRENLSKSNAFAADVPHTKPLNFKPCKLCKRDKFSLPDHSITRCPVFKSSSDKHNRISELNGCVRCSGLDHKKSNCITKFEKRCGICNGWHLEILCNGKDLSKGKLKPSGKVKDVKEKVKGPKVKECDNGIIVGSINKVKVNNCIVLPTVTGNVKTKKGAIKPVSVLLDTGSQLSFIKSSLAEQCGFKVTDDNLCIDINGFNSKTRYNTKSVLAEIGSGDEIITFEAVCVPQIRTSHNLNGVEDVAQLFEKKGYRLASQCYKNSNREISVMMGVDTLHILEPKVVTFGHRDRVSAYLESRFGVILMGNMSVMRKSMDYLPDFAPCSDVSSGACEVNIPLLTGESSCRNIEVFSVSMGEGSTIFDLKGQIDDEELLKATEQALNEKCNSYLNLESPAPESLVSDLNIELCDFMLENTVRDDVSGRLILPLPWNPHVKHLLGDNFNLARQVLDHNVKRLKKDHPKLVQYNEVIALQEKEGIIERICDLESLLRENPRGISFLAHNGVFKPDHQSTKCRVVFLSNLCGSKNMLSHNQCSLPGPNLNHKMSTTMSLLRFDKYLVTFDLKQAFLQLMIRPEDSNSLLFLWYGDVLKEAQSLVAYRFLRLPFGLRFSPFVLMVALYIILIHSSGSEACEAFRRDLYELAYMDNLAWTSSDAHNLVSSYHTALKIFGNYGFKLQQFNTNNKMLQAVMDVESGEVSESSCKLFGLVWQKDSDKLHIKPLVLNGSANTKRLILSSLHSVYDLLGICLPVLNRARLFLHKLQTDSSLDWDTVLSPTLQREWSNIVKQVHHCPSMEIDRSFGERGDCYDLLCFTDASKLLYGCVLYLKNHSTGKVTFLVAKNRVISEKLKLKTMPVLELVAMQFGVHSLMDVYNELQSTLRPIQICSLKLFTDSTICLSWVSALFTHLDKMQGKSVFVMNKLESIRKLCQNHEVEFNYIPGIVNPANWTTREISGKLLLKTTFHSGPPVLEGEGSCCKILVPNPVELVNVESVSEGADLPDCVYESIFPLTKYSSFRRAVNVVKGCFLFIHKVRIRLKRKGVERYGSLDESSESIYEKSCNYLIRESQRESFPELFNYFRCQSKNLKDIPDLCNRLNLYMDEDCLIRVKSKMSNLRTDVIMKYPLLLSKTSPITKAIIWDLHVKNKHSGVYCILNELRREFWILQYYSAVKNVLRNCVWCKRQNSRTIKTNVNAYKEFRVDPSFVPFRDVMVDHMGPFNVKLSSKVEKVWVLIVTCLFTRAVSLNICLSLDTSSFLRALQMHVLKYGLPKLILSDQGSSIVSGVNVVIDFLNDFETRKYLSSNGIGKVNFETYPSGASWQGGLVETMVKQCKRLLSSSIHNRVMDYFEFEYVILETETLINKRPIAFKDFLRDTEQDYVALTPEMIVKGYSTINVNVIPQLQSNPDDLRDKVWIADKDTQIDAYEKLRKVKDNIREKYHSEFLATLVNQAVDRQGRYKPVKHSTLSVGDLVCIRQPLSKPLQYPLAVVKSVKINDLGETVSAQVMKSNKHVLHKHANDLILLLKGDDSFQTDLDDSSERKAILDAKRILPPRDAREKALQRIADISEQ